MCIISQLKSYLFTWIARKVDQTRSTLASHPQVGSSSYRVTRNTMQLARTVRLRDQKRNWMDGMTGIVPLVRLQIFLRTGMMFSMCLSRVHSTI